MSRPCTLLPITRVSITFGGDAALRRDRRVDRDPQPERRSRRRPDDAVDHQLVARLVPPHGAVGAWCRTSCPDRGARTRARRGAARGTSRRPTAIRVGVESRSCTAPRQTRPPCRRRVRVRRRPPHRPRRSTPSDQGISHPNAGRAGGAVSVHHPEARRRGRSAVLTRIGTSMRAVSWADTQVTGLTGFDVSFTGRACDPSCSDSLNGANKQNCQRAVRSRRLI